jgi:hypothetical protein
MTETTHTAKADGLALGLRARPICPLLVSRGFFLSSRRNQWALDALGKQPVAHSPPPVLGRLSRA